MFCRLSQHRLSLSTTQLAEAVWKEGRGRRRPPILWAWRPATPAARPPWLAPCWMDTPERRNQSTTACRKGIPLAGLRLGTPQCERWTKSLACCWDSEGLKSDRRCHFGVALPWVLGSRETASLPLAAGLSDARAWVPCSRSRHCPRKNTAALVHILKRRIRAGRSPPGHSAGLCTVDLHWWAETGQPAHSG